VPLARLDQRLERHALRTRRSLGLLKQAVRQFDGGFHAEYPYVNMGRIVIASNRLHKLGFSSRNLAASRQSVRYGHAPRAAARFAGSSCIAIDASGLATRKVLYFPVLTTGEPCFNAQQAVDCMLFVLQSLRDPSPKLQALT
jgi:hypothetical protein